jgi:predicted component of type VI protein secretion system
MLELAVALVIVALIAGFLINKKLDFEVKKFEKADELNNEAALSALLAPLEERITKFDSRINDTWSTISSTKQELEALRLAISIKGNR